MGDNRGLVPPAPPFLSMAKSTIICSTLICLNRIKTFKLNMCPFAKDKLANWDQKCPLSGKVKCPFNQGYMSH